MKGLFQPGQGQEGDHHAHASDQQGAGLQAEITAAELKDGGDRHHHAAHEIGNGGGDRGPEVRAELLGGDGDENGPIAAGKAQETADPIKEGRAPAPLEEIKADAGHGQQHKEEDHLFPAL